MVAAPKDDKLRFELVLKVSPPLLLANRAVSQQSVGDGSCFLPSKPKPAREVST